MGLKPTDIYLIAYNALCCAGWAQVLIGALEYLYFSYQDDNFKLGLETVFFSGKLDYLIIVQLAAVLEIVHAAVGLVRSPVMVTTMQVMSRVVVLFPAVFSNGATQYGAGLMVLAWSMVEVPRYAFYIMAIWSGDATKGTPYPLFWLRYSLFAILYPMGIFGELTVCLAAAKDTHFALSYGWAPFAYGTLLPVIYFFGSPFMIFNMYSNRVNAMKKRFARPPPPPRGVSWPEDEKGQRSSTNVNKAILAAAVGAVNKDKEAAVNKTRSWRFGYVKHLAAMVEEQCKSPEAALKIAQAGLDKAYDVFEFIAPDGSAVSLREAMESKPTEKFHTAYIQGEGKKTDKNQLEIPYDERTLRGDKLKKQVKEWVDYGTIEPSAGDAIISCVDHPEYLDLSDRYFVLLGAGSAMGPFLVLMALGANVIAVDLDRDFIWKRLIKIARLSSGSITFPLKVPQDECKTDDDLFKNAGCNLFTHTPMIRDWLLDLYPGKDFTVGSYAYLDGARHVQVSLAMDAICKDLSEKRKASLAYLCTPTDLHLVPKEAYEAAKANYKSYSSRIFCMIMNTLSQGKLLRKNYRAPIKVGDEEFYLLNGISVAQGPNYALAKRMQHWRAIIARSKGCIVSSNIAPSTSTVSVVHNRTFAWAYEGMPYFEPYEIFAPETSNAVMSAILFNDLNDPKSVANPKTKVSNPNQLFSYNSFHGGLWRAAYEVDSIGETSVLIYFWRASASYIAFVVLSYLVFWCNYGKLFGLTQEEA
ncbi:3-hydroxyacyl-CoA dehydratase 2 [Seminavis robusta]|uniref:very-long-chain (3R)-3-hydroxyacyl-CoA dehydratase n=1 Tax=Seminavis robusta TaxID=568900 RepID=A0A9N8H313_9STRA|nr:3-hydroxyacyl-CoA dehydratase 2 [Seminavis robusta]|eukprot:Sro29_g018950.1 3-hydroxyacyl-CoA dehydratase 2 (754) ;mRNA; f:3332-5761